MSNSISTISQNKYIKGLRTHLFDSSISINPTLSYTEINLISPKLEVLHKKEINNFRDTIAFYFKDYFLSTFCLFMYAVTYLVFPKEKTQKGLGAYYLDKTEKLLKRIIDIGGSVAGIILFLPLFFIIGMLIKLDSYGPVFFKQERVGMNRRKKNRRVLGIRVSSEERKTERRGKDGFGKPFYLYKFRTMVVDAEKGCGPIWAKQGDPRITQVGKVLRKTRMDELPQLLNVLKGEMSLVGPRPERYHFVKDFTNRVDGYHYRLKVKPGITGLAQVENGYDSSIDDVKLKVYHDLNYIREWSILKDFVIMLKTILVVALGKGAY